MLISISSGYFNHWILKQEMRGNAINEFIDSTLAERLSCFDFDCHLNLQMNLLFPPLGCCLEAMQNPEEASL